MKFNTRHILPVIVILALGAAGFSVYTAVYAGRILPGVRIGIVPVGGLTTEAAESALEAHIAAIKKQGIALRLGNKSEAINLDEIDVQPDVSAMVSRAVAIGREGAWYAQLSDRLLAPIRDIDMEPALVYDDRALERALSTVAEIFNNPGKDIRYKISGTTVKILTDTKVGQMIDQREALELIRSSLARLDTEPIRLTLRDDVPVRDPASIPTAKRQAEKLLSAPLQLRYGPDIFTITPVQLGQWIDSTTQDRALIPTGNREKISTYVTTLAAQINIAAQTPVIKLENGKITEFKPPRSGMALEEEKMVEAILAELENRRINSPAKTAIELPVKTTKPVSNVINGPNGIIELIGKATTTFAGSPTNRISNIKNGVKFLTGALIAPGEEFSMLEALGTIDNTTGYLPELVIKENRTIPEFGGGLCQVSTTLFRSVINSGLPVTERRNHSYRVSYYEKDGQGQYIGPGLDATIFQPDPDFRFKNDTPAHILIYGYVVRDTLTFELYGTDDGREVNLKGPTILTTIPAGDPIYAETDTLPAGVTKQIETAHPGGTALAIYTVRYPDGKSVTQEFRSYYRRWPARYLVGTGGAPPNSSPTPLPSATPNI